MKYLSDEQRTRGLTPSQAARARRWARVAPDPEARTLGRPVLTLRELADFFEGGADGGSGREFLYGDLVGVGDGGRT